MRRTSDNGRRTAVILRAPVSGTAIRVLSEGNTVNRTRDSDLASGTSTPGIRSSRRDPRNFPVLYACLLAVVAAAGALGQVPAVGPPEYYRLRIVNQPGGPIEVSTTEGQSWEAIGKVRRAATATALPSSSIGVAAPSAVAGIAPDSVLLRLPGSPNAFRSLRIIADREPADAAAIQTDIPVGGALFRLLAPPPGSPVRLEREGRTGAVPAGYTPRPGDRLVILVQLPEDAAPPVVTLENKEGGSVTLTTASGVQRPLARVKQPLRGIGRYARTDRAGAGTVLSWTPTAVLISTAPNVRAAANADGAVEERGGFVIQPAEPNLRGTTHPPSQLLVEALPDGDPAAGLPLPPVSRLFGLSAPVSSGDVTDAGPTRVEVRLDEGEWEPVPALRGTLDGDRFLKAIQAAVGPKRTIKTGITHLRVLFGSLSRDTVRRRIQLVTAPLSDKVLSGKETIRADVMGEGVAFVLFQLNGKRVFVANLPPFSWDFDTTRVPNGEHLIEVRGLDKMLGVVTSSLVRVRVEN